MAERGELVIESGGFPRRTTWALAVGTRPVGTNPKAPKVPTGVPTEQTRFPEPKQEGAEVQWGHAPPAVPIGATDDPEDDGLRLIEGTDDDPEATA